MDEVIEFVNERETKAIKLDTDNAGIIRTVVPERWVDGFPTEEDLKILCYVIEVYANEDFDS